MPAMPCTGAINLGGARLLQVNVLGEDFGDYGKKNAAPPKRMAIAGFEPTTSISFPLPGVCWTPLWH